MSRLFTNENVNYVLGASLGVFVAAFTVVLVRGQGGMVNVLWDPALFLIFFLAGGFLFEFALRWFQSSSRTTADAQPQAASRLRTHLRLMAMLLLLIAFILFGTF